MFESSKSYKPKVIPSTQIDVAEDEEPREANATGEGVPLPKQKESTDVQVFYG